MQMSSLSDSSTKQKLFSTTDIPTEIEATVSISGSEAITVHWTHDIPGYEDHVSEIPLAGLKNIERSGAVSPLPRFPPRAYWNASHFKEQSDFDYETYMSDDNVLLKALQQLHTHGLLFVSNVPESEESVTTLAERIGPLKNTFYGRTWDVRSVPEAKNVAYTSQNLGFHMDLLYMKQPPHLQLLHCIRSSSAGGASLFTDSFRAVEQLAETDHDAIEVLSRTPSEFHYDHPESQHYYHTRPVVEQRTVRLGCHTFSNFAKYKELRTNQALGSCGLLSAADFLDAVSWAPPFQAPFGMHTMGAGDPMLVGKSGITQLSRRLHYWHKAAKMFDTLIHQPEGIYERLMKPGECVIFDNRRVLHARKAFEVGDAGKERWLRGAYIDKDPYLSKMRVLTKQLGNTTSEPTASA